jgi:ubiquitin-conjugating enzyme E2 D/E
LAEVTTSPPEGIKISLVDEANIHNWNITMDGPEGSPYAVHLFSFLPPSPFKFIF